MGSGEWVTKEVNTKRNGPRSKWTVGMNAYHSAYQVNMQCCIINYRNIMPLQKHIFCMYLISSLATYIDAILSFFRLADRVSATPETLLHARFEALSVFLLSLRRCFN